MAQRTGMTILLTALALSVAVPAAVADTLLGAAPARLEYDGGGGGLLRGQTAERSVIFQNQGDEPATLALRVEGPQADWVTPARDRVTVAPGERETVTVTVAVPETAANGDYEARLRATPQETETQEGEGAQSTIVQALVVPVRIQVTDTQSLRLSLSSIQVPDLERGGPLWIDLDAANAGNVDATPVVEVTVLDEATGDPLASFEAEAGPIAPGQGGAHRVQAGTLDLAPGAYRAQVVVSLPGGEVDGPSPLERVFEVHPPGTLSASGTVTGAGLGTATAAPESLVPITVDFENTGDRPVVAKLRLTVERGGQAVDLIESDLLQVDAGETLTFEEYWRATEPGTYHLAGQVTFDGRQAAVPGQTLTVAEPAGDADDGAADDGEAGDPTKAATERTRGSPGPGLWALAAVGLAAALARRRWSA